MPRLSIIVPVYKAEKYIHACLDSILNQTYQDFELILVDDGSPDKCGEICEEYAKKDNRIKVIHKENGGQSSARNMGIDAAQGEVLGFVDSDDTIDKDMYANMLSFMDANDLDIVCCDTYLVRGNKTKVRLLYPEDKIFTYPEGVCENLKDKIDNAIPNKIYKKFIFDNLRFLEGIVFEDVRIVYLLFDRAKKIGYISKPYYYYYRRKNSTITTSFNSKSRYEQFIGYKNRFNFAVDRKLACVGECRNHAMETALSALTAFYANSEDEKSERWNDVNTFIREHINSQDISKMRSKHKFLLWSFKNCKVLHKLYAKLSGISKRV